MARRSGQDGPVALNRAFAPPRDSLAPGLSGCCVAAAARLISAVRHTSAEVCHGEDRK